MWMIRIRLCEINGDIIPHFQQIDIINAQHHQSSQQEPDSLILNNNYDLFCDRSDDLERMSDNRIKLSINKQAIK